MNARQCAALNDKADKAAAAGTEIGILKAAYLRAAARALASGRAAKVAKIGGTSPVHYAKFEKEHRQALDAMHEAKRKLSERGVHVKERRV